MSEYENAASLCSRSGAACASQLLDLHDRDMARVSEALNRAIAERDHAREEWHRQNERADDYRRQLLDETYRPEGGEIVLRELRRTQRERDEALAKIAAVEALIGHARKISPSPSMHVYVADLERALGMDAPRMHKTGGNG